MSKDVTRSIQKLDQSSTGRSNRRSFLKDTMVAGAAVGGAGILAQGLAAVAQESIAPMTQGAAAILALPGGS